MGDTRGENPLKWEKPDVREPSGRYLGEETPGGETPGGKIRYLFAQPWQLPPLSVSTYLCSNEVFKYCLDNHIHIASSLIYYVLLCPMMILLFSQ